MKRQLVPGFIIVDDDSFNNIICQKIILSVLPEADIKIFTNPEEALSYLQSTYSPPVSSKTVLFLDINMKTISGWDFLTVFEQFETSVKGSIHVYMLSSSINPMDKLKAINNKSLWNYIEKPLTKQLVNDIVNKVSEEESTSLSRQIQDKLGQQLMRIKMDAVWLSSKVAGLDIQIKDKISSFLSLIDETAKTTERIDTELRPRILDELGLFAALEWQTEEFTKATGVPCKLKIDLAEPQFSRVLSISIFSIYQEALNNVTKHPNVKEVNSELNYKDGKMILSVQDTRNEFNIKTKKAKDQRSSGLLRMQKQAAMMNGEIRIKSIPSKGTKIELVVPVII